MTKSRGQPSSDFAFSIAANSSSRFSDSVISFRKASLSASVSRPVIREVTGSGLGEGIEPLAKCLSEGVFEVVVEFSEISMGSIAGFQNGAALHSRQDSELSLGHRRTGLFNQRPSLYIGSRTFRPSSLQR